MKTSDRGIGVGRGNSVTRCVIVLALAAASLVARAETLSIEGMSIGQSHSEFVNAHPGIRCPAPNPGEIRECSYRRVDGNVPTLATVAGQPANTWLLYFVNGKLAHVLVAFPRASLDKVYRDVYRRLGKPAQVTEVGGSTVAAWADGSASLALRESFTPDNSALVLILNDFDWRAALKKKPGGQ